MKNPEKLLCGALSPDHGPVPGRLRRQRLRRRHCQRRGAHHRHLPVRPARLPWTTAGRASSRAWKRPALVEGTDYTIDYQNASFDDNMAIQIAQAFSAEDAALMVGIATPAATACYAAAEDKDIPVVFTAITDPVGAQAGFRQHHRHL